MKTRKVIPLDTAAADSTVADAAHAQIYDKLSEDIIQGQIPPLMSVSLRSLAQRYGVSPMPVREAVRRLIAEKALELQPENKRLRVPHLNEHRLLQLMKARQWVEAELAYLATPHIGRDLIKRLKDDDTTLMTALGTGDVSTYMQANHDFHFSIYAKADADLLYDMARTLWLQAGPFMRVVFGRLGTVHLPKDHHQDMIAAFERGDAEAVRASMTADIHEGMELMLDAIRSQAEPEIKKRRAGK